MIEPGSTPSDSQSEVIGDTRTPAHPAPEPALQERAFAPVPGEQPFAAAPGEWAYAPAPGEQPFAPVQGERAFAPAPDRPASPAVRRGRPSSAPATEAWASGPASEAPVSVRMSEAPASAPAHDLSAELDGLDGEEGCLSLLGLQGGDEDDEPEPAAWRRPRFTLPRLTLPRPGSWSATRGARGALGGRRARIVILCAAGSMIAIAVVSLAAGAMGPGTRSAAVTLQTTTSSTDSSTTTDDGTPSPNPFSVQVVQDPTTSSTSSDTGVAQGPVTLAVPQMPVTAVTVGPAGPAPLNAQMPVVVTTTSTSTVIVQPPVQIPFQQPQQPTVQPPPPPMFTHRLRLCAPAGGANWTSHSTLSGCGSKLYAKTTMSGAAAATVMYQFTGLDPAATYHIFVYVGNTYSNAGNVHYHVNALSFSHGGYINQQKFTNTYTELNDFGTVSYQPSNGTLTVIVDNADTSAANKNCAAGGPACYVSADAIEVTTQNVP